MRMKERVPREPREALDAMVDLGRSVRAARMRRRMTAADFAGRVGVSLPTLRKLESGDPGVSWGIVATALWVLGLLDPVRDAVRPENDGLAALIEVDRLPKRVRRRREIDLADL